MKCVPKSLCGGKCNTDADTYAITHWCASQNKEARGAAETAPLQLKSCTHSKNTHPLSTLKCTTDMSGSTEIEGRTTIGSTEAT